MEKQQASDDFFSGLDNELQIKPQDQTKDQKEQKDDKGDKDKLIKDEIEEEEEEDKDKKKEEDRPKFSREEKKEKEKTKPDKDESIQILRTQRDEATSKLKQLEESLGLPVDSVKPLIDFIKEKANGPLTEDAIKSILQDFSNSEGKLKDLEKAIAEKEGRIRDIDIRQSTEFKEKYQQPFEDAWQSLYYEFANLNPADGSTIGQKSTQALMDVLTGPEADKLQAKDVTLAIRKFVADYKQETGEDPSTLPSVSNLLKAQREFIGKRNSIQKAYQNWTQEKEEAKRKSEAEQEQQNQLLQSKAKRERVQLATKAYHDFDRDEVNFIEEKNLSSLFDQEFDYTENIINGTKDAPTHDVLYIRGVKSRIFDEILPKYKELLELERKVKKGNNNEIRGGDGGDSRQRRSVSNEEAIPGLDEFLGLAKK